MTVVVVGISNLEVSLPIGSFPIEYTPVEYLPGLIRTRVAGVGFNVARALATLGSEPLLLTPLADDAAAGVIRQTARTIGIDLVEPAPSVTSTPRSVVLVDDDGQRKIFTDLGEAVNAAADLPAATTALHRARCAVFGNIGLSRPLLDVAHAEGVPVVVDLQDVHQKSNPYDDQFLAAADLVLMSDARVVGDRNEFLIRMRDRTSAGVLLLGMGDAGALYLRSDDVEPTHVPAPRLGAVTNTTGAGDTFLAALVHHHLVENLPIERAAPLAARFTSAVLAGRTMPDRPGSVTPDL